MNPYKAFVFCLFLLSASCEKKKPEGPTLPPITQEGKNTFGCKINGEIFVAEGKLDWNSFSPNGVKYRGIYTDSSISVEALTDIPVEANFDLRFIYKNGKKNFAFTSLGNSALVTKPVENRDLATSTFGTDDSHSGLITLNFFQDNVIAGTFSFDAVDSYGEVVHVTEGRFDIDTR